MPKKSKKMVKKPISFVELSKRVWLDVGAFWKLLLSVLAVYAVINFIFVASFSLLPSNEALQAEVETYLGASAGKIIDSMVIVGVSVLNFSSPGNTFLQVLLFIFASTAFIWTLRKLRGLQKISIRQAYYEGPANIIPLLIVSTLLLLTLVPSAIASSILTIALPIIGSNLERTIVYIISAALVLLSVWLVAVWWPAFYISMLPGTKPIASLRAGAELTKRRRSRVAIKLVGVIALLVLVFVAFVIPVSLIWQRIVPVTVYAMLFLMFGLFHMYAFNLYRSLIDEPERTSKKA
jgi:hypothetical protein